MTNEVTEENGHKRRHRPKSAVSTNSFPNDDTKTNEHKTETGDRYEDIETGKQEEAAFDSSNPNYKVS